MSDRCSGNCCRTFMIGMSREHLLALAEEKLWQATDPDLPPEQARKVLSNGLEILQIWEMVRPIRALKAGDPHPFYRGQVLLDKTFTYTCANLLPNGDCGSYATRPRMCRAFPYSKPCEFPGCAWSAGRAGTWPPIERRDGRVHLRIANTTRG